MQLPVDWFIDQLTRHMSPELKTKKVDKKKILGLEATFDVLTKLESTLRTKAPGSASDSWIEEFCNHPHNGHIVLLNFIHDLPLSAAVKYVGAVFSFSSLSSLSFSISSSSSSSSSSLLPSLICETPPCSLLPAPPLLYYIAAAVLTDVLRVVFFVWVFGGCIFVWCCLM